MHTQNIKIEDFKKLKETYDDYQKTKLEVDYWKNRNTDDKIKSIRIHILYY